MTTVPTCCPRCGSAVLLFGYFDLQGSAPAWSLVSEPGGYPGYPSQNGHIHIQAWSPDHHETSDPMIVCGDCGALMDFRGATLESMLFWAEQTSVDQLGADDTARAAELVDAVVERGRTFEMVEVLLQTCEAVSNFDLTTDPAVEIALDALHSVHVRTTFYVDDEPFTTIGDTLASFLRSRWVQG